MSRLLLRVCGCASLCALAAAAAVAAQQPTFRAGANFVRVDMYVTEDGRFVDDLKPDEIEVREDGRLQRIESFERVHIATGGATSTRTEPNTIDASRQAAGDPRARVFVIFLDTYHTQVDGSASMRLPLVRFLDRVLGPDDLVAVMTPEMSAKDLTFGRKTTVVRNMMENNPQWGTRGDIDVDEKERLYNSCYPSFDAQHRPDETAAEMRGRRREKLTLDALEDLVAVLSGLREERKAVLTVSEGWVLYRENKALAAAQQDRDGRPVLPPPGVFGPNLPRRIEARGQPQGQSTASAFAECESDRMALALMDDTNRLRDLTERANRGNVSFYTIYARRLSAFDAPTGFDRPPALKQDQANLSARQDSLGILADNTDGLAIVNSAAIDRGIDRIVSDLSSYYLLGYYSTNTKLDGRFRTISVRVARPGVQVRARRGYRGLTANDLVAKTATVQPATPEPRKAVDTAVIDRQAPFRIRASSWVPPSGADAGRGHMWVVGELEYRTRKEPAWSSGAHAEVTVVAADGTTVMTKTLDVAPADGAFSVEVPEQGGVAAGEYAVRVRVRPQAGSAPPLTDTARVAVVEQPAPIGEAVLWRRGPSTGTQYVMTADARFMRTERLRIELPTRGAMPPTAKLLDRGGKAMAIPVQLRERTEPGRDFRWIVADVTLAPLAIGDYAIEVTTDGATRVTAFRIVP
jgi:VWFA-related protein